jgi:hypothetical protein
LKQPFLARLAIIAMVTKAMAEPQVELALRSALE